jgi:predicted ATP-binding protein involved in virulence
VKIQSIELHNVGGIQHLKIENINKQMNIICGENGVGKTTLIDSIGHIFTNQHTNVLKKNILSEKGTIVSNILDLDDSGTSLHKELYLDQHKPNATCYVHSLGHYSKKLILLKVDRTFNYQMLHAINKDEIKDDHQTASQSINGIGYHDIKSWFLHRHLYSAHQGALQPEQIHNFSFSRVDPNENEIMINTPSGEIYYEYLSSGFKSIISIVFGIIKEIELRFKTPFLCADQFDGIIEIDEIELHLHPEWQGKACSILKQTFPLAQFFITTHSPHVVQTASQGEVIALERNNGQVLQRELPNSEYGYQGWTIEEVLRDVMGMSDLRTGKYEVIRNEFLQAFKNRNKTDAEIAFDKLEKMLHPNNELKTIYQMQLDSIGE